MVRLSRVLALLFSAAVSVLPAQAKQIEVRITSSGFPPETNNDVFAGPSGSVSRAGVINGVTYSASGSATEIAGHIQLELNTASSNGTNLVRVVEYALTVTGLTPPASYLEFENLFSGANAAILPQSFGKAEVRIFYDENDVKYGTQHTLYDSGSLGCGAQIIYSCAANGSMPFSGSTFSLTELLFVEYRVGSQGLPVTSNDNFTASLPEPGSLAMLGSGLAMAAWCARRRRIAPARTRGCIGRVN